MHVRRGIELPRRRSQILSQSISKTLLSTVMPDNGKVPGDKFGNTV